MRIRKMFAVVALGGVSMTLATGQTHQVDPSKCAGLITKYVTPGGTFYTDDHGTNQPVPGPPGESEFWLYMESNNHAGLQKGGYNPVLLALVGEDVTEDPLGEHDRCDTTKHKTHARSLKPDTILF